MGSSLSKNVATGEAFGSSQSGSSSVSGGASYGTILLVMDDEGQKRRGAGLALASGFTVGFLGVLLGLYSFVGGDRVGGGLCFTAAAVAFGLLANACLRD